MSERWCPYCKEYWSDRWCPHCKSTHQNSETRRESEIIKLKAEVNEARALLAEYLDGYGAPLGLNERNERTREFLERAKP